MSEASLTWVSGCFLERSFGSGCSVSSDAYYFLNFYISLLYLPSSAIFFSSTGVLSIL